jgi:hypothetical protein
MTLQLSSSLITEIQTFVGNNPSLKLDDMRDAIKLKLWELAEDGQLSLGLDHWLTGDNLEIRVHLLFQEMGFAINRGRPGLEDFVVTPPSGAKTALPLVIEVKSERKPQISRDNLRQLDDWVFDLSQEDVARKNGLGRGFNALAFISDGLIASATFHPNRHKGVLIINAPLSIAFGQRGVDPLASDELAFAVKRNFCVITIQELVAIADAVRDNSKDNLEIWEAIHRKCGILSFTSI